MGKKGQLSIFCFGEAESLLSVDSGRRDETDLSTNHQSAWSGAGGLGDKYVKGKQLNFLMG